MLAGREGDPSPLARFFGTGDVTIHEYVGWALAGAAGIGLLFGVRAAVTFVRDSLRYQRGDARWLARWPLATFTGRFEHHAGHFDPGQRIANLVIAGGLLALIVSGVGLILVSGGPAFVWFVRIHKYATYVVTVFVAGHVLIASGILPGYRGVWRAMHGRGGGVTRDTARRLWPGWTDRALTSSAETSLPKNRRKD